MVWFNFVKEAKQKKVAGYWGTEHPLDREIRIEKAQRYQQMEDRDCAAENAIMIKFITENCAEEFKTYRALEKLSGRECPYGDDIERYGEHDATMSEQM